MTDSDTQAKIDGLTRRMESLEAKLNEMMELTKRQKPGSPPQADDWFRDTMKKFTGTA